MLSALRHWGSRAGRVGALLGLVTVAALAAPAGALARPANDDLGSARPLELPARVDGTVVGATVEPAEPPSSCGPTAGSVWYQFKAPADRRAIVLFDAAGDLDAVVDLYRRTRSRLDSVDCEPSDSKGQATLDLDDLARGETYLIRVAKRPNSAEARFQLDVLIPTAPATPPGRRLPGRGVTDAVTRLLNPSDAWSATLRAGRSYRVNLNTRGSTCTRLLVYPPGTKSFDDASPVRVLRCGGYQLLTPRPGGSGRYTFLVQAARRERRAQRYHLQVAKAGRDDTAPGLSLANFRPRRGALNAGGIDVIDLYRFDVARRSAVALRLRGRGNLRLLLLKDSGRRIDQGGRQIRRNLRRGRYVVAVRSDDDRSRRYALVRASRTITRSRIVFNGARRTKVPPGATARIGVLVAPSVTGVARIDVERFDPLEGWQFFRRFFARVVHGRAVLPFRPPGEGHYRARALFLRTRSAAASATLRDAHLQVARALRR
jgi:hypothetical protein